LLLAICTPAPLLLIPATLVKHRGRPACIFRE
jgi:hypothetical protein